MRVMGVQRGRFDGCEAVILAVADLEATFVPGCGMVGVSLRHAGEELIDRGAGLAAYAERGAVVGIPFLHPWANRLAGFSYSLHGRTVRLPPGPPLVHCDEHGLPIHGLLAASRYWTVAGMEADSDTAYVLAEVCEGLHAAHELKDESGQALALVHRDVSPQNVMVSYDGHVRLLDFGVAKIEAESVTKTGEVKGKTAYMSPEQAMGD